jgi:hypothetical protein
MDWRHADVIGSPSNSKLSPFENIEIHGPL